MTVNEKLDTVLRVLRSLVDTPAPRDVRELQDGIRAAMSMLPTPDRPAGDHTRSVTQGQRQDTEPPLARPDMPRPHPPLTAAPFMTDIISSCGCAGPGKEMFVGGVCASPGQQPLIVGMIQSDDGRVLCVQVMWIPFCVDEPVCWMP